MQKIDVRARFHIEWDQLETRLRTLDDAEASDLAVLRGTGIVAQAINKLDKLLAELQLTVWPEPFVQEPDLETLQAWMDDGVCEATDGCLVELDGRCPHGHPSWLVRLGGDLNCNARCYCPHQSISSTLWCGHTHFTAFCLIAKKT